MQQFERKAWNRLIDYLIKLPPLPSDVDTCPNVLKETARGFQLIKEKQSHKIDLTIALAMAALAAIEQGQAGGMSAISLEVYTRVLADVSRAFPVPV